MARRKRRALSGTPAEHEAAADEHLDAAWGLVKRTTGDLNRGGCAATLRGIRRAQSHVGAAIGDILNMPPSARRDSLDARATQMDRNLDKVEAGFLHKCVIK